MLNRLKQFIAKSHRSEPQLRGLQSRRLMALTSPAVAGSASFFAAKKRKKKKKPVPTPRPAPKKAQRKPPTPRPAPKKAQRKPRPEPQRQDREDLPAPRAEGFFSSWRSYFARERYDASDWGRLAILVAALLVVLYYAFSAGGFFVIKRGYGELVILYLLVMGLIFSLKVGGGSDRFGQAEIALFGGYALWMLLSATWSLSPYDSIVEFNRAILYLAGFLIFYLFLSRREWLGWLAALFVVIVTIVAADGLLLKVAPDYMADYFNIGDMVKQIVAVTGASEAAARLQAVFLKMDNFQTNRLSYPLTYWNTMGLIVIMAVPLALSAAADRLKPLVTRCLSAAVLVPFAAVLYFTFSRAGYLLFAFIVLFYILLSAYRLRVALHAGLAALWAAVLIASVRLWLPAMVESQPSIDARVSQGHRLGLLLLLLLALAVAAQVMVVHFEKRIVLADQNTKKIGVALAALSVLVVLGGFGAITASSGGPIAWFKDQLSGASQKTEAVASAEERIFSLQSERYDEYKVSLKTLADHPLTGTGSGTWEINWLRERPYEIKVRDGHSWLFDTMAELGVVGFLLLAGFVAAFFMVAYRYLRRLGLVVTRGHRSREGDLYAAVLAACAAMLLHSLIDWDWEMPVVTLPFFMFAGALLRYGILTGPGGEQTLPAAADDTASHGSEDPAGRVAGSSWQVWALGVGCIAMMGLTVVSVISETRHDSAQQRIDQGRALAASNMTADAAAWYQDGLDIATGARKYNSIDARFLVQMGDANRGLADIAADEAQRQSLYDTAEGDYLEALRLQPDNYETYQRLAEVYLRTAQPAKAADALRRARELNPRETITTPSLEERVRVLGGF